jgi:hypothetical protein
MLTCVDSRAPLVPIGSLTTCTVSVWPSKTSFSIGRCGALGLGRRMAVQVGHVQEGRALEADVDEGRLHAGQHARHLAEIDVADEPALQRAFDVQFLDAPFSMSATRVSCGVTLIRISSFMVLF